MSVHHYIQQTLQKQKALLAVLIDPGKTATDALTALARSAEESGIDLFLVGGSLLSADLMESTIRTLKAAGPVPVVIFPGGVQQLSASADALLFLSLISGRNPDYLIGQHIISAPLIRHMNLEAIATAYMLIESGHTTSVEFISGTKPIPAHKDDIAVAHALAAEYLGFKMIYLEAGSGAQNSVPVSMIRAIKHHVSVPLIVGGGLRTPQAVHERVEAGADIIVIGTHFENTDHALIKDFSHYTRGPR
ncbi:MAG: geranylgeranylglyceryl/heptaprenylglyceryl phosphate synthase [Calditrichaeota bacterium]|nr:MAG: geranylgeranylglyceryl/heptaprenylglyceryl phosphate synthase [Calditrichota bacterium]